MTPSAILCADWGKDNRKRSVYAAEVGSRAVRRLNGDWSVAAVLAEAERRMPDGPVLVTFDAPLGVPASYLTAVPDQPPTFLHLLSFARATPHYFDATFSAADWRVERPFFAVPAGKGGLTSYREAAARAGVDLLRGIDKLTRAKTAFAKSGIPGSVGSAACALWREFGELLVEPRPFRVWPFEGTLEALFASAPVVVGEMYPRAAYATALGDGTASSRAPMRLAKTDAVVRRLAIETLLSASWVRQLHVSFDGLEDAQASEDDFDACLTAAALLRCVLEKVPLARPSGEDEYAEGGILGTGSVNLYLPERTFGARRRPGDST